MWKWSALTGEAAFNYTKYEMVSAEHRGDRYYDGIGVAIYDKQRKTLNALIEAADQAMYVAKQSGRNRVCVADSFK